MNETSLDKNLKKALLWVCYFVIVAGAVYALYTLRFVIQTLMNIMAPFVAGFIVAYLFDPIVTFIQRRLRLSRIFGLVLVYVLIILVVALFFVWLLPILYGQLVDLLDFMVKTLPDKITKMVDRLQGTITPEQEEYLKEQLNLLEQNLKDIITASLPGLKAVATGGASAAGAMARGVINVLNSIVGFFSFISFVIIVSFYLIVDFNKIRPAIEPLIPPRHKDRFFDLLDKVDTAVGGFLRGQLTDCFMVGILTSICLFIAGFKEYALIIGVIAGAGNIVPYLGPILGATPAVIIVLFSPDYVTLIDKIYGLLIVAGIFIFVQAVEGFVFQPRIVGKNSQLHPLLVLLALIIGGQFGIAGLIVAIPVAAAVRVIINELWWQPLVKRHAPAAQETPEHIPEEPHGKPGSDNVENP